MGYGWVQAQSTTSDRRAKRYFQEGREYEADRLFEKAIKMYQRAVKSDPDFAEAYQKLGILHHVMAKPDQAKFYYEKGVEKQPDNPIMAYSYFELGRYRMDYGKYEEAKALLLRFLKYAPQGKLIRQRRDAKKTLASIEYALEGMKTPVDFDPEPLSDKVNNATHQFFPVLTADKQKLIFTTYEEDGSEDFYESEKADGEWLAPKPIADINTPKNEGTCSISADGRTMIFTACQNTPGRKTLGSCDLFITYKTGDSWSEPENIGSPVNTRSWESQPALSADGKTLFFSSTRPGGLGKRDIWMSRKDSRGNWSKPVNLGNKVNTAQNEFSPFIHTNGKNLFFSSNGHQGYGLLDLFRSDLQPDGTWGEPRNLGYPINNAGNQVGLFITSDGTEGYYSDGIADPSSRVEDKLFRFDINQDTSSALTVSATSDVLSGKVYDAKTEEPLGAKIDLIDLATEEVVYSVTSDSQNGRYSIVLTQGAKYALYVDNKGYLFKSLTFNYKEADKAQNIQKDIPLDPIEKGKSVELENIFFATDSYELEKESKTELSKVLGFMEQNADVKMEIGAHTDSQGAEAYNQELSQNRAKAVVEFLVGKGIPKERLVWKGYGESKPVGDNSTEEGRALNRRITFKVL